MHERRVGAALHHRAGPRETQPRHSRDTAEMRPRDCRGGEPRPSPRRDSPRPARSRRARRASAQAIVADAFASIRQDRFYTQDWGASSYTAWGFEHAKSTVLADVINRHLGTNSFSVNRLVGLEKLPDWAGPPEWSQVVSFNERGFPILKEDSPGGV